MTKGSPYKKFIDGVILKMFESGMLNNILQRWKIEEPDCSPLITSGKPLDFTKLISIFFIIILGVLLAIIMVLFENFQNNLFKKKNNDLFSEKDFVNQKIEELLRSERSIQKVTRKIGQNSSLSSWESKSHTHIRY